MTEIQSKQMALCLNPFAQYFIAAVNSSGAAKTENMRCHYFRLFLSYTNVAFITAVDGAKHLLPAISQ